MKLLHELIAPIVLGLASVSAWSAPTTQLGFLIDGSGSIGSSNFNIMKNGYAAALAALPTDGSIELTVYTFQHNTAQVVAPTVVTPATLPTILASINSMSYPNGGSTRTADGINAIVAAMTGSTYFTKEMKSIINIATDGEPNPSSQGPASITAAQNARAQGIDAMTAEAIGSSLDVDFLRDIVFSPVNGPCNNCGTVLASGSTPTDPMTSNPWVLRVDSFDDFPKAIGSKVQAIVNPNPVPEPGTLLLLSVGIAGLGLAGRRKTA